MSFEGYYEYKCPNHHRDIADVYTEEPQACRECGERWVKIRLVDETNAPPAEKGPWWDVTFDPEFGDYTAEKLNY